MAALVNDEEYAELILDAQERSDGGSAAGPSLSTWTPEMDALASINDKLAVLIEVQKKKPARPVPYARPKTALSQARAQRDLRRRQQLHERLTAQLVPTQGA